MKYNQNILVVATKLANLLEGLLAPDHWRGEADQVVRPARRLIRACGGIPIKALAAGRDDVWLK